MQRDMRAYGEIRAWIEREGENVLLALFICPVSIVVLTSIASNWHRFLQSPVQLLHFSYWIALAQEALRAQREPRL